MRVLLGLSFTSEDMGFDFCHSLSDVAFSSFFVLLAIHMSFSLLGFKMLLNSMSQTWSQNRF